jgi:hypothetical protein
MCLFLRPFDDTSIARKVDRFVEQQKRLLMAGKLIESALDAELVADRLLSLTTDFGGSERTSDALRSDGLRGFGLHDQYLVAALPKTVMAYCLRPKTDELPDPDDDLLWDGYLWSHRMLFLGDGAWTTAPSDNLSNDKLFQDLARHDWRAMVNVLVAEASIIIMIPSGGRGTRWELQLIKARRLLGRTIFAKPPYFTRADWDNTRRALRDDFVLPEYRPEGFLFTASYGARSELRVQWQEIVSCDDDLESISAAMDQLRPDLMNALRRRPRDQDLPMPDWFRFLINPQG